MAPNRFSVIEHVLPASHIREYPKATAYEQEAELHLAVKQYTPTEKPPQECQRVTIVGAHANGFPKELYEPLWDEMYEILKAKKIYVGGIWIADVAHQGASGVLNENLLGNDPSWFDHPRDLFLMINHFRRHMKRPIIGIGHSMGGNNLINLSFMHPRLFTTLILMDPIYQSSYSKANALDLAKLSAKRRERWSSRSDARAAFQKSKFYQQWDPRVLENYIEYGLRDLPTLEYPEESKSANTVSIASADRGAASTLPSKDKRPEVTLTTTKDQEVLTFVRPIFKTAEYPNPLDRPNPRTHPDFNPGAGSFGDFYRSEAAITFEKLPFIRPSVLYVFAENSSSSVPILTEDKMKVTGTGHGGSGGAKNGRVEQAWLKGVGHLIPMEAVRESAEICASWIGPEVERWARWEELDRVDSAKVPGNEKSQMSEEFLHVLFQDRESSAGSNDSSNSKSKKAKL